MADTDDELIAGADWPLFGWRDDVRPALAAALAAGRPAALATLYRVEGSAPRGPGAQMLFDGNEASGYFSGDCIEGDVARHAAEVLADGVPQRLHYGMGSPWIDIRLRCGGALYILLERIAPDSPAARALLSNARARRSCLWSSDGATQEVIRDEGAPLLAVTQDPLRILLERIAPDSPAAQALLANARARRSCQWSSDGATQEVIRDEGAPLLAVTQDPLRILRRYDPPRRLIVSGGDPGALALAQLAAEAQFETILLRPGGPGGPGPFAKVQYLREEPSEALPRIGVDRWTAYVGATHEDHHDLGGCFHALRHGAGYVGMIGAKSRAPERLAALERAGATPAELARLRLSPGIAGLGKAPWEVAVGILAEVMQALNPAQERA